VVRDGIPITSLPRTLLDLAAVASQSTLTRAVEEADRLNLLEIHAVRALRRRHRGRRGVRSLDQALAVFHEPVISRSELEHRFVELCAAHGLPLPAMNVLAAGYLVDALWPAQQIVAELDGYEYHHTRSAIERDRSREAALGLAGYRVLRFSFRQVSDEPEAVAASVRAELARYAARRPK
jgi:hypothetical protein